MKNFQLKKKDYKQSINQIYIYILDHVEIDYYFQYDEQV